VLQNDNMSAVTLLLDYWTESDVLKTRRGDQLLHSLLTLFEHHTFQSTMRLISYCIQDEVNQTGNIPLCLDISLYLG